MLRITDAVKRIVQEDAFAIEAMQRGLLNLTAYAKEIVPEVERNTLKPVKAGSVVVALARIQQEIGAQPISPHVTIQSFSITSNLCTLSYPRVSEVIQVLQKETITNEENQFVTITEGNHEVTIICPEVLSDQVKSHFSLLPKVEMGNLVALSIRFSEDYISVPNTIYSLVGVFALRHINILEIVSTYTELSFVIDKSELENAIKALESYSEK